MENGHYPKFTMIIEALQDLAVEQMHQQSYTEMLKNSYLTGKNPCKINQ
jgi:hypothetical protein